MRIDVLTVFPDLFARFLRSGVFGRAVEAGILKVGIHDLRDYSGNRRRAVDDEPYGGGGGMVMTAPPWIRAVRAVCGAGSPWRVLLSPQGLPLNTTRVRGLSEHQHLVLLCGRYEGLDERVIETVVDEEVSIGDFVISGGECAAMVLMEAVSREIPGVVGRRSCVERDSFRGGLLDYPHYTRPPVVEGLTVPDVLLSGNHAAIAEWRRRKALEATRRKRSDLLTDTSEADSPPCAQGPEET